MNGAKVLKAPQVSEYLKAKELAEGEDLRTVVDDWLRFRREREELVGSSDPMDQCIEEYMEFKVPQVSNSWGSGMKTTFRHVKNAFGTMPIGEVTWEDINIYLKRNPWRQETRADHRKVLNTFFQWAVDIERIPVNPLKKSKRIAIKRGTPDFFSEEEAERFLRQVEKDDPGFVCSMLLGLFAGIRAQEVCRMRQDDIRIDEQQIYIRSEVANPDIS